MLRETVHARKVLPKEAAAAGKTLSAKKLKKRQDGGEKQEKSAISKGMWASPTSLCMDTVTGTVLANLVKLV